MSAGAARRGAAVAPLVYWLLVVGGLLAAHRVIEHEPSRGSALWVGATLGTLLGQAAAWRRVSLKAFLLIGPIALIGVLQIGALVWLVTVASLNAFDSFDPELGVMAFVPALVCGYASLTDRGGLVAFWFPVALWTLAIVDGADGSTFGDTASWALLSVLAALFVAFLAAREARRIAVWRQHATVRLAPAGSTAVLRRSPTRGLSQAAWTAAMAGATLALTAWIAPHLWQNEKSGVRGPSANAQAAGGAGGGAPCCPETPDTESEQHRLREYFPLLHPHGDGTPPVAPCVACVGGAPPVELSALSATEAGGGPAGPFAAGAPVAQSDASPGLASAAPPVTTAYSAPASPSAAAPVPTVAAHPGAPHPGPSWHGAPVAALPHPVAHPPAPLDAHPVAWLLALAFSSLVVPLALRPLRRLVTLRHLRDSLWPETIDQRISNLWQLALVGLRDAGWHAAAGEQPLALARRAAVPGAEVCAVVLERTRHGARLEATDLEVMRDAAQTAYRAARRRAGHLARALSWLRWPLV